MELTGLKYQVPVSRRIAERLLYAPSIYNQRQGIEESENCPDCCGFQSVQLKFKDYMSTYRELVYQHSHRTRRQAT